MKTMNLEQMENVQGGKVVWRWTDDCKEGFGFAVIGSLTGAAGAIISWGLFSMVMMTDCLWVV